jgi:hypothetical protein
LVTLYPPAFQFILKRVFQTLTTVGFGDMHAYTDIERLFALILMIFGVGFYSFSVGMVSALLSNIDRKEKKLIVKL